MKKVFTKLMIQGVEAMKTLRLYKADFSVGVVSVLILNAVNLLLIGIWVYNFNTLGGWGMWDLLFLYSFRMLSRSIYGIFCGHLPEFEELIVSGSFDAYLIRPASPFLQFLGKDINYMGVGDLLVGVAGFILGYFQLQLEWGFGQWGYFILCIISGAFIQMAINWSGASLCISRLGPSHFGSFWHRWYLLCF